MRAVILRSLLLTVGLAAIAFGALGVYVALDSDSAPPPPVDTTLLGADEPPTATPIPTATLEPPATATPAPEVPIARLIIPSIKVNAQVNPRGILANGVMEDPKGPTEVAWYTFSTLPNHVGNIVMAGHVDYANYGAAVFYNISKLKEGDEIQIDLVNGERATYRVTNVTSYDADTAPVAEIVGPTDVETVTLITCGGTFNRSTRDYDRRTVVRAEREL